MKSIHVRNVIVGAGAVGSAAAYHLARRGEPVLLIEQFRLGHDRGSSHGEARITRHSYADERYARLMPAAFREWKLLEADAGEVVYLRTGGVSLGPPGDSYVSRVAASLEAIGCPHRRMDGREWRRLRPEFAIPNAFDVVYEPDAGAILAKRAQATEIALARHLGGDRVQIWDECPVREIGLEADRPTLLTASHRVTADRLILAAGPWTEKLLPGKTPPLRVEKQQILYVQPHDLAPFVAGRFPVFIVRGDDLEGYHYGMPALFDGLVKIARDGGPEIDPSAAEDAVGEAYIEEVREAFRSCLPALAEAPVIRTEICKYTMAPAKDFLVDFLPPRRDVILASPCSGHGFKFSILIGRILADLSILGETEIDASWWKLPAPTGP